MAYVQMGYVQMGAFMFDSASFGPLSGQLPLTSIATDSPVTKRHQWSIRGALLLGHLFAIEILSQKFFGVLEHMGVRAH